VGRPGSGKSFLIEELIINPDVYKGKFHRVLFLAPKKFGDLLE